MQQNPQIKDTRANTDHGYQFIIQVPCMLYGSYGSVLQCKFQPFVDFVKKEYPYYVTSILSTTEWMKCSGGYCCQ